jgi:hypothetical protein
MKRGQVSIFLLIGLIILLAVAFFLFYAQEGEEVVGVGLAVSPIQVYVEGCLEVVGVRGAEVLGQQGGYNLVDDPSYEYSYYSAPYYLYDGDFTVISKGVMEDELDAYIESELVACLDDFSSFVDKGYDIDVGSITVTSTIASDQIDVVMSYPITAKHDGAIISLDTFVVDFPSVLGFAHTIAEELLAVHKDDTIMPLGMITYLAEKNGIDIITLHSDGTVLYSIKVIEEYGDVFTFTFAVYYNWGDPIAL